MRKRGRRRGKRQGEWEREAGLKQAKSKSQKKKKNLIFRLAIFEFQ